ncbi:chaperone protein DnaJ [Candidatus Phytoplasma oryzae]|uniref:Chaperone protein DnaJ n=1 Tax=Candidatus Phytoplasma oryzae TaxID=203274 RepID=A0A139JQK4_9MOLU|nr:molecular chaperone DnaJ [Candidatus Phytoplasma oryzae]KXT29261.1 chaperone protein DnaJ [Candidatus Phytoplasma oryzae]RAM57845.1 molecular chaperone DnaJ [Candidatus Phytoplasma oryzae]
MNQKKDYYEILGLSKNASKEEITKAYRELCKKFHPDLCKEKDAAKKFNEVQEAFKVLNDPQKKARYDRFGHNEFNNFNQNSSGFQGFNQSEFDFSDIFQGFEDIFSGQKRSHKKYSNKGEDKNIQITIDFVEAALGTKKNVKFNIEEDCKECKGTGARSSQDIKVCSYCNGSGYISSFQRTLIGNITTQQICPQCHKTGKTILNKCLICRGKKRANKIKTMQLDIPAGVEEDMTLKIANEGNGGSLGEMNGDLYVNIKVRPHDIFQRKNQDVYSTVYIDFFQAILGEVINVSTIYGIVSLKIPAGTQTDTKFRLKNKGIPYLQSSYKKGDHYIIVKVQTPTNLSNKEKELLQELKNIYKAKNYKKSKSSWFF